MIVADIYGGVFGGQVYLLKSLSRRTVGTKNTCPNGKLAESHRVFAMPLLQGLVRKLNKDLRDLFPSPV